MTPEGFQVNEVAIRACKDDPRFIPDYLVGREIQEQLEALGEKPVPRIPDPPDGSRAEELLHIAEDLGLRPGHVSNVVYHNYGNYHVLTYDQHLPGGMRAAEGRIRLTDDQVQAWRKAHLT